MKKISLPIVIVLGIILDQVVKMATVKNIKLSEQKPMLKGLLSLTHLQNDGAAWSILEGQQWFFVLTTVLVLVVAIWFWLKNLSKNWYAIGLTLIISGALGNFIDRVRQGYVVDMFQLDFINFPIFNVADILLSVGFVVLFIGILIEKDEG
ncbi:signal peptidase II [Pseudolactococcus reticulitermitis]|uniref:signal peptidase II n=1 Tax=Pseudolactococcus reticulitermitis TaxID=2025039 RepID=UPI000B9E4963